MSKRKGNLHLWKVRGADRRKREVEAKLAGSKWTLSSRFQDEEDWTIHEPPLLDDLIELHELLFKKYQRKQLAWEHLVSVYELIEGQIGFEGARDLGLSEVKGGHRRAK